MSTKNKTKPALSTQSAAPQAQAFGAGASKAWDPFEIEVPNPLSLQLVESALKRLDLKQKSLSEGIEPALDVPDKMELDADAQNNQDFADGSSSYESEVEQEVVGEQDNQYESAESDSESELDEEEFIQNQKDLTPEDQKIDKYNDKIAIAGKDVVRLQEEIRSKNDQDVEEEASPHAQ